MAGLKYRISSQEAKDVKNALVYSKFKSPGILARLLLESFIFEDGDINSDWFVREKVCAKGTFSKLRERLIEEQWVHFREDSRRYFPGIRLKPHLEDLKRVKWASIADLERKADRSELANKADKAEVSELRDDIRDIRAQLHQLFQKLAECNLPPPSEQKQEEARLISKQIEAMMMSNKIN